MSASSYSTVFLIIPLFNIIIDHIEDTSSTRKQRQIQTAAEEARKKAVQYYSKTNLVTMLCTALDPRRKFHYFTKRGFSEEDINGTKAL
jgi:hypothetical protein